MFLQNLTPDELGCLRILANESKAFKEYFNSLLQIFILPEKENLTKMEMQKKLEALIPSNFIISDKKKLNSIIKAIIDYPQELFNLGFIILSFRQEFRNYLDKFISNYNSKKDAKVWKEISNFINRELNPKHFTKALNGSRNIIYLIDFPKEFNLSIGIRKRLSAIEKHRVLIKTPNFLFKDDLPQFRFSDQMTLHEKLFHLSSKERDVKADVAKLPFPLFTDENNTYQVMEFVQNPTLWEYRVENKVELGDIRRAVIEEKLKSTFAFWNDIKFKHNDLHSNNILIDPNTKQLTVIDFDLSQFCDSQKKFDEPYTISVGNKVYTAQKDRDIEF